MARPVMNNCNVMQSYMLTAAKYDFSVYEKRILYCLVKIAQNELSGKNINEIVGYRIQKNLFGDTDIEVPVRSILANEEDKNYVLAKKAFKNMAKRTIEQTRGNIWMLDHMLERVRVNTGTGIASFRVSPNVWNIILDFTKGYRLYELKTVMNFRSVYSMRLYEIISGQDTPLSYAISYLKEMFNLTDKYKLTTDFIRKVIEPAKRELDSCSPVTFDWKPEYSGKKITSICFIPINQPKYQDMELAKKALQMQTSPAWDLDRNILNYLKQSIGFTTDEIKRNIDLWKKAQQKLPDLTDILAILKGKSREKDNPKGWIIRAIEGKLADLKQ